VLKFVVWVSKKEIDSISIPEAEDDDEINAMSPLSPAAFAFA